MRSPLVSQGNVWQSGIGLCVWNSGGHRRISLLQLSCFPHFYNLITQQRWQSALDSGSEPGFGQHRRGWSSAKPCRGCRCWRCPCWPSRTGVHRRDAPLDGRRRSAPPRIPTDPPSCTSRCPPSGRPLHFPWTAAPPPFLWCEEAGANKAPRLWWRLQEEEKQVTPLHVIDHLS